MAEKATETHGDDIFSGLGNLWSNIQLEVSKFYEQFEGNDDAEQTNDKPSSNIKLDPNYLPSSFTAEIQNYWDFLQALPWKESFMIGLVSFHVLCFVLIVMTRRNVNLQYIIFFLLLVAVYCSESLNELAAEHYKKFAAENYFDSGGLFISTVFSAPVLFNCIGLITIWLTSAASSLIDIKKQQSIIAQRRKDATEQKNDDKKNK